MDFVKEAMEKCIVKYSFTADSADWENALTEAYKKTKGKFSVEGFRKGHAPKAFIEKIYGKGVFYEDAIDFLLQDSYEKYVLTDKDVEIIDRPEVDVTEIKEDGCKFAIMVPTSAKVTLGAYTGLEVEKVAPEAVDDKVNAQLEQARDRVATIEEINDRPVQDGDIVNLDYSGSIDGVKFDGGTAEKQELVIGSKTFIPGFEDQMIGMKVGDEKDLKVTFPKEYGSKELAGKDAIFAVKVNSISVKVLPKMDDEFAKEVSEFDTLDAYKANLKENFERVAAERAENATESKLIDKIIEGSTLEYPNSMVERQIDSAVEEFAYRLQSQGLKIEDYFKFTNSTMEQLREQRKESAEYNVKLSLVLEEIVKAEKIELNDDEKNEAVNDLLKLMGKEGDEEAKKNLKAQELEYAYSKKISDKLRDFLMSNNKIA